VLLNFCGLDIIAERDTPDKAKHKPAPLPSIHYYILPLCLAYSIRNSEFNHVDGVDDNDTKDGAGE
jgi:hypothetical protein